MKSRRGIRGWWNAIAWRIHRPSVRLATEFDVTVTADAPEIRMTKADFTSSPKRRWMVLKDNGPIACADCGATVQCERMPVRIDGVTGYIYAGRCACGPGWNYGV